MFKGIYCLFKCLPVGKPTFKFNISGVRNREEAQKFFWIIPDTQQTSVGSQKHFSRCNTLPKMWLKKKNIPLDLRREYYATKSQSNVRTAKVTNGASLTRCCHRSVLILSHKDTNNKIPSWGKRYSSHEKKAHKNDWTQK